MGKTSQEFRGVWERISWARAMPLKKLMNDATSSFNEYKTNPTEETKRDFSSCLVRFQDMVLHLEKSTPFTAPPDSTQEQAQPKAKR